MTPEEILADVNAALKTTWCGAPDRLLLPVRAFWTVLKYPTLALRKKTRRPAFACRQYGYGFKEPKL